MNFRFVVPSVVLSTTLLIAPAVLACSFQKVGESQITYTYGDGSTETVGTAYYQWVNCGSQGPSGPIYDPTPPPGTYGPPSPPPPPTPPSVNPCTIAMDSCDAEYIVCVSSEPPEASFFGIWPKCGAACLQSCQMSLTACRSYALEDNPGCDEEDVP